MSLHRTHILTLLALLATPAIAQQQQQPQPTSRPDGPAQAPPQLPPLGKPAGVFGQGVQDREAIHLADVVGHIADYANRSVRVDAVILEVCTRKGCWMTVRDGAVDVTVRFKDYGFFVPRDAAGRRVLVQGQLREEEVPEDLARHYAEESGHPERAAEIHGPQKVLGILATGVEILGADGLPLTSEGAPEARTALAARLARATRVQPAPPPADVRSAFRTLREVPGARTEELPYVTEQEGFFVFSGEGEGAPFQRGWAIKRATGDVFRF